jgi:FdhD protein
MSHDVREVPVERLGHERERGETDDVVVEEPLEIRIGGETLAITMRTPGHDHELVVGFLLAEGVIASVRDVGSITHCRKTTDEGRDNTIDVTLAPGIRVPVDEDTGLLARRGTMVSSACGVCGRRSVDDLIARIAALAPPEQTGRTTATALGEAVRTLRERQPIFARTGGSHAASLMTLDGAHVATYEDVGRHNAVDKVVGSRVLAEELPLSGHALVVSGRASFEIIQKALAAGVPVVASVSAPSSLAVDLARRANLTLAGFVRDASMTIYSAGDRIHAATGWR